MDVSSCRIGLGAVMHHHPSLGTSTPMAASMEQRREKKRQLDVEIAEHARSWKTARTTAAALAKHWKLEGHTLHVALAIYIWSGCCLEPTVDFLKRAARKKHWPEDKLDEEIAVIMLDSFAAADDAFLLRLTDAVFEEYAIVQREAQANLLKWGATAWVTEQNRKGITPSSATVLDQLELIRLSIPQSMRPVAWGANNSVPARMRMSRLRHTHGGRIGALQTREDIEIPVLSAKSRVAWQWFNHLYQRTPAGKVMVLINIDETAICLCPTTRAGNLFISRSEQPVQRLSKSGQRANLTHVAMACSDPEIQRLLPQVIIGNHHTIPAGTLADLQAKCYPRVSVLRNESSWVNGQVFAQILRMLAKVLAPHRERIQPVVQFDTYGGHLKPEVWAACTACRLWPMLVPAQTTWFLQGLDTEGFGHYKLRLQRAYQDARISSAPAQPTLSHLIDCVLLAIHEVLDAKDWCAAFARNGFSHQQVGVSVKKLRLLGLTAPLDISSDRPALDQLRLCFPRRRKVPTDSLWRAVDGSLAKGCLKAVVAKPVAYAAAASSSSTGCLVGPIAMHTRSKTKATTTTTA